MNFVSRNDFLGITLISSWQTLDKLDKLVSISYQFHSYHSLGLLSYHPNNWIQYMTWYDRFHPACKLTTYLLNWGKIFENEINTNLTNSRISEKWCSSKSFGFLPDFSAFPKHSNAINVPIWVMDVQTRKIVVLRKKKIAIRKMMFASKVCTLLKNFIFTFLKTYFIFQELS